MDRTETVAPVQRASAARIPDGALLGHFKIGGLLGEGGMGEVYRARDTRLGRDVAIKILPGRLASDPEALHRFETEAHAASALNHPNIVAVFDVGRHEGAPYVVEELVEGKPLSGPLPLETACDRVRQVCAGLGAAHDHGVVHRDIKPGNLLVTRDGVVKILDFGLAKLLGEQARDGHTQSGAVMGTPGYMSPEQVRGEPVDARSDLFSVGVVLYELLSGQKPFAAPSSVERMAATLERAPAPLEGLPTGIALVLARCLEKDPQRRFQNARDLGFALTAPPALPPKRPRRSWSVAVALLVGALAGSASPTGPSAQIQPRYTRLTFRDGLIWGALFAPDAHSVLYSARWRAPPKENDIYLGTPEGPEARGLGLGDSPFFSVSKKGELAIISPSDGWLLSRLPLGGGAPRAVATGVTDVDWSPGGDELAIVRSVSGRRRIEYPIGRVLFESDRKIGGLRVAPDDQRIAFIEAVDPAQSDCHVMLVDRGGHARALTGSFSRARGLAWAPSGEVWFSAADTGDEALRAVTLDGQQRTIAGAPGSLILQDIAPDGRVLLTKNTTRVALRLHRADEAQDSDLSWFDGSFLGDLSADGKTVLFNERGAAVRGTYRVYVRNTDGSDAIWLGTGSGSSLSPDRAWALLLDPAQHDAYRIVPTGPGPARTVSTRPVNDISWPVILPDGKRILFSGSEPGHGPRLYLQDMDGGPPRAASPEGLRRLASPRTVSPDGKLAAAIDASGAVVLVPMDGGEPRRVIGSGENSSYFTDGTGDLVFQLGEDGSIFVADRSDSVIWRIDPATGHREFMHRLPVRKSALTRILLTGDARSYAYSAVEEQMDLYLVEGLR
jgi:serine/threonine protein kinase/Tol biopolymer transport system component